jgi:DNA polymerase-4
MKRDRHSKAAVVFPFQCLSCSTRTVYDLGMILHVDMDAFYASVEQRDRPELCGKPVIVGGSPESRGVVSAASYEARKFGVHSAMPTSVARRLCPDAIFLPVRMQHYAAISRQIRSILESFTPLVEPLSLDEAFLDSTGTERLFGSPASVAGAIKRRVRAETNLIASVGVAPNKFVAKLASDLGKPDGLVVVDPAKLSEFLAPLPVGRIWGVGAKAERRLHAIGFRTIGQIAAAGQQIMIDHFRESGRHIAQLARGIDDRAVVPDYEAKSVSSETTFPRDIADRETLRGWLLELTDQVAARLRSAGIRAHTIEIKVRSSDFQTHTRATTLGDATDLTDEVWRAASELFDRRIPNSILPARLIGVAASGLERNAPMQRLLFDQAARVKQSAADHASDKIRQRFGDDAIRRAGTVAKTQEKPG